MKEPPSREVECLFCVLEEARPGKTAHLVPIDCVPMEGKYRIEFGQFHTSVKRLK